MIKIYSKPDCKWCNEAKTMMDRHEISYKEYVIGEDVTRSWVMEAFPTMKTVPIILKDNVLIGGYDSLIVELAKDHNFGKTLILG